MSTSAGQTPAPVEQVNLDLLILQVQSKKFRTRQVLNQFMRTERLPHARRVSSDFDYEAFRNYLHNSVFEVENDQPVFGPPIARGHDAFRIDDEGRFWVFLTNVQAGGYNSRLYFTDSAAPVIRISVPNLRPGEVFSPRSVDSSGKEDWEDPLDWEDPRGWEDPASPTEPSPEPPADPSPEPTADPSPEPPVESSPEPSPAPPVESPAEPEVEPAAEPEVEPPAGPEGSGGPGGSGNQENPEESDDELDDELNPEFDPPPADNVEILTNPMGINLDQPINPSWKDVATFFAIDENAINAEIPGLKRKPRDDQLYAIYFLLTRPLQNINISLIGDEVGLGKTTVGIMTTYLHHRLQVALRDVEKEWGAKKQEGPRKHFRADDPIPPNSACPSKNSSCKWGFECPCLKGDAYKIAKKLRPNPSVVFCPPGLIPLWQNEVKGCFDFSPNSEAREMSFLVYRSKDTKWDPDGAAIKDTQATARYAPAAPRKYRNVNPKRGPLMSRFVIFVSRASAHTFAEKYVVPNMNLSGHNLTNVSQFIASFVFFDEVHLYHGSPSREVNAFEFLQRITADSTSPTVAVGFSASMLSGGPTVWRGFVNHMFDSTTANMALRGLENKQAIQRQRTHWDALVESNTDDGKNNERLQELREFLQAFLPRVMLRRTSRTKFRGKTITRPSRAIITTVADMPDGPAREAQQALSISVRSWVDQNFQQRLREWNENGRVGDEPDRKAVQKDVLESIESNVSTAKDRSYQIILRSSCFPALAHLIRSNTVRYRDILRPALSRVSEELTEAFKQGDSSSRSTNALMVRAVNKALESSPFFPYRNILRDNSPKFRIVCEYIDHMMYLKTHPWTESSGFPNPGPQPDDGSSVRHCLIFCHTQISSFLMFMLLFRAYGTRVELIYIHPGIPPSERQAIAERMCAPCTKDDRNKVLISSFPLMGVGYNVQRANYCLITEMPSSQDEQNQLKGRIDRTGQMQTPISVQLYDSRNLAENIRYNKSINRARLINPTETDLSAFLPDDEAGPA